MGYLLKINIFHWIHCLSSWAHLFPLKIVFLLVKGITNHQVTHTTHANIIFNFNFSFRIYLTRHQIKSILSQKWLTYLTFSLHPHCNYLILIFKMSSRTIAMAYCLVFPSSIVPNYCPPSRLPLAIIWKQF